MIGHSLSHYKITAELGRGGMGIVYKATDIKLNRDVALKILPAAALASEDDRARFFREAQSAAQLHHPNIATVFEIDEAILTDENGNEIGSTDGPRPFIAMEYIAGETLQDLVKKGPLSLQMAVNIAGQIAEALKAAHAKDIVHRDIKSANVMITASGVAKVLDFGLAKTNHSTMLTRMGSTLGTVAYMSPEQARGQEVDGRSDLYSLGTVLYEMIAGRLPFNGEYEQAVLYSILNEMPESLTAVRAGVPMQLDWLVNKLLSKEAEYRYQTAGDLIADLKSLDLSGSGQSRRSMPTAEVNPSKSGFSDRPVLPRWVWPAIAGVALVFLVLGWLIRPTPDVGRDPAIKKLTLQVPLIAEVLGFDVSADGQTMVLAGIDTVGPEGAIYLLDLESSEISKVPGVVWGSGPQLSPAKDKIIFSRIGDQVKVVPYSGGTEQSVQSGASDKSWAPDGSIVYRKEDVLWWHGPDEDAPRPITTLDSLESFHGGPYVFPDGQHILFHVGMPNSSRLRLSILDLKTGKRSDYGPGSHAQYLNSGHLLYRDGSDEREGPLMLRPFDVNKLEFVGPEVTWRADGKVESYAIDSHGTWYESILTSDTDQPDRYLYRIDPEAVSPIRLYEGSFAEMRLSPDGSRMAMVIDDDNGDYAMILDLETGVKQRVTTEGDVHSIAWAPDGKQVAIARDKNIEIWSSSSLGLQTTLSEVSGTELDWSYDGSQLVYVNSEVRNRSIHIYDLEAKSDSLLEEVSGRDPRFSPDGRFLAYDTRVDGVSVRTVVRSLAGGGITLLSVDTDRVARPFWSQDGSALYVEARDRTSNTRNLVRVPVDVTGAFRQTGQGEIIMTTQGGEYELGKDGSLFVRIGRPIDVAGAGLGDKTTAAFTVIVNWFEQVKKLAPPSQ